MDAHKTCTCHEVALEAALRFLHGRSFQDLVASLRLLNYTVEELAPAVDRYGHVYASGRNHLCCKHNVFLAIKRQGGETKTQSGILSPPKPKKPKKRRWLILKAA